MNQFVWDLRSDGPTRATGIYSPRPEQGYRVGAGTYTLRMTLGDKNVSETVEIASDPRMPADPVGLQQRSAMAKAMRDRVDEINQAGNSLRSVREQLTALAERVKGKPENAEFAAGIKPIQDQITPIESRLLNMKEKTQQDEVNFRHGLADQYSFLEGAVEGGEGAPTKAESLRMAELDKEWDNWKVKIAKVTSDIAALNAKAKDAGIGVIAVPANK